MDTAYIILALGYCIVPLATVLTVGFTQKYLFLREKPRAYRWWPAMTAAGLLMGAVGGVGLLFFLAVSDFFLVFISFSAIGILGSLFQFWLLGEGETLGYLPRAWVSSLAAGFGTYIVWFVYQITRSPSQCPVAGEGEMLVWLIPLSIVFAFLIYGVGTSIALHQMGKAPLADFVGGYREQW